MADDTLKDGKPVEPDTHSGTTSEEDFGRTDRYANKDAEESFNFRTTGDRTAWDSGRGASVTRGTQLEEDVLAGDAETPGVPGKKENR